MNWTTEVPKESGWYWVKIYYSNNIIEKEVVELDHFKDGSKQVYRRGYEWDEANLSTINLWGDKLETPE